MRLIDADAYNYYFIYANGEQQNVSKSVIDYINEKGLIKNDQVR